jgi:hypothetical protein
MDLMQHRADMANSSRDKAAFATRRKNYMEQDFDPRYYPSSMPLDIRLSRASEYTAYQLGQINRKLDRLVEAAEQIARSHSRGALTK